MDHYYLTTSRIICHFVPLHGGMNELFTKQVTFFWNELERVKDGGGEDGWGGGREREEERKGSDQLESRNLIKKIQ